MDNFDKNINEEITSLEPKTPNFIILESVEDITEGNAQKGTTPAKPRRGGYFGSKLAVAAVFAILGGFSIGAGIGFGYFTLNSFNTIEQQTMQSPQEMLLATTIQPLSSSMVSAVERVKPSVVSIETITTRHTGGRAFTSPFFNEREVPASGTGIVFYEDNTNIYIVTNEHVISNANSINIYFGRNRNNGVEAFVKGRDIRSDLAVLYVPRASLQSAGINNVVIAEFGNSSDMQIGEFVMAIGNALGQGITTTMGVVSATEIEIEIDGRNLRAMQTDAAINPGNSGGPLINSAGQVIGINTVKISRPHVYGMGYSITSNVAMPIIDGIMNQTARPTLGIVGFSASSLEEYYRYGLGLANDLGVFIDRVQPNSGAYRAGLQTYDVITHFNGTLVRDMDMLRDLIFEMSIGDSVAIGIMRDSESITLNVELTQF